MAGILKACCAWFQHARVQQAPTLALTFITGERFRHIGVHTGGPVKDVGSHGSSLKVHAYMAVA